MTYKGYIGAVEYDDNAKTLSGRVVNANVLVSFRSVVDAYLEDCRENGIEPERPYNGTMTVRVDPEVHTRVALRASEKHLSMNRYVEGLLRNDLGDAGALRLAAVLGGSSCVRSRAGLRRKKKTAKRTRRNSPGTLL